MLFMLLEFIVYVESIHALGSSGSLCCCNLPLCMHPFCHKRCGPPYVLTATRNRQLWTALRTLRVLFGAVADAVVAKGYGNRPAFVFRPTHVVLQRDAVSDGESGGEEPAKVEDLPVSDGESGAEEAPCCLELEAVPGQT